MSPTLNTGPTGAISPSHTVRGAWPSAALASLRLLHAGGLPGAQIQSVRRAWPGAKRDLVFEGLDADGQLRAGRVLADGEVMLAPYAKDNLLPGLRVPAGATLAVHRLGKRAVTLHRRCVVKHLRAGKATKLAVASQPLATACHRAGIGTAQLLEAGNDYLVFARIGGATLHALSAAGLPAWQEFALRWAQLARPTGMEHPRLALHGPEQEVAVLRTWYGHARSHGCLPRLQELERAVEQCSRQLLEPAQITPRSQWVTSHRDLHDKQLMWDGKRLNLLDLDTAALAEAALDLGNLSAHVDLRVAQGVFPANLFAPLTDVVASLADQLGVTARRLATYKRASALRLAFVYSFRPSAQEWLPGWVQAAVQGGN